MERRGLLEMLISCSEERVYYRVLLVACACVYLSDVSVSVCVCSSGVSTCPRNGPGRPPFIVEGEDRGGTCVCYVVRCVSGGGVPSPVARYYGCMVDGVVLSLVLWSDAPVTPGPVRRGNSCGGRCIGSVPVAVRWTGAECRGRVDAMTWVC